jgi:hypothetical protein
MPFQSIQVDAPSLMLAETMVFAGTEIFANQAAISLPSGYSGGGLPDCN